MTILNIMSEYLEFFKSLFELKLYFGNQTMMRIVLILEEKQG